jgi:sRNA-binding carbon storage regulator CsrA
MSVIGFSAPLTISKKDFDIVREEILEFIQNLSKRVDQSDSEIVACLNIDWFKT